MDNIFTKKFTIKETNNSLWLAVDVQFSHGRISGRDAPELWRAVIKDGLLASRPIDAMQLLEPLRTRGLGANVDCPGWVIECRDRPSGSRIFLKFLGSAFRFAPACLLALENGLRQGVGQHRVEGSLQGLQAWQDDEWHDIAMPLLATQLHSWLACPATLAGFKTLALPLKQMPGTLTLNTRSRWVWRKQGQLVSAPPELVDVIELVERRVERFQLAWGDMSTDFWRDAIKEARRCSTEFKSVKNAWQKSHRHVGGKYPGHGHHGFVTYEGSASEALLFCLHVGSFLHVGQQTSIGLGGYAMDFSPSARSETTPK